MDMRLLPIAKRREISRIKFILGLESGRTAEGILAAEIDLLEEHLANERHEEHNAAELDQI